MKLIGIVGRFYYNKDNQEIIQTHETVRKAFMKYDDVTCITILPTDMCDYGSIEDGSDNISSDKLNYVLDKCDAFVVPGGTYSYKFDEYIINYAIEHDKPLLAICLGFQAFCSMFAIDRNKFNLTERKDLPNHVSNDPKEYKHKISIKDNTLLKSIIGEDIIDVNSLHHDIVDFELKDAIINAYSDDGIVEGAEYPNKRFILALEWHPEYLLDDNSNKILDKFIESIR